MTNEKIGILTSDKKKITQIGRDYNYFCDGKTIYCCKNSCSYKIPLASFDTEELAKNALVGLFDALKSGDNYYSFIAE